MRTYASHRPTAFDSHIGLEDRENWLLAPVSRTRDSGPLAESNFTTVLNDLGGESEDVEVHRFGHWGPGWYEIVIVRPGTSASEKAERWEDALDNYPVADDEDFSRRESDEANDVWQSCFRWRERIAYIRKHDRQFEFSNLRDMIACVRGEYFAGYADELIS